MFGISSIPHDSQDTCASSSAVLLTQKAAIINLAEVNITRQQAEYFEIYHIA